MVLHCRCTGEVEKSDIRFHNSSHLSKQVSNSANSFTVTGRAGMVFMGIEGVYCLKPREQQTAMFKGGPIIIANNPISKPYLGGNCISNTIWKLC